MPAATPRPAQPARVAALHAVAACALGAWAALLFAVACAPDLVDGPSGPPAGLAAHDTSGVCECPVAGG